MSQTRRPDLSRHSPSRLRQAHSRPFPALPFSLEPTRVPSWLILPVNTFTSQTQDLAMSQAFLSIQAQAPLLQFPAHPLAQEAHRCLPLSMRRISFFLSGTRPPRSMNFLSAQVQVRSRASPGLRTIRALHLQRWSRANELQTPPSLEPGPRILQRGDNLGT